jgi:hypothetical protein
MAALEGKLENVWDVPDFYARIIPFWREDASD